MISMLLTPEEAARILGLSPFTVRRLLREGELPGRKVGKRQWRIRRVDLEEYLGASSTSGKASTETSPEYRVPGTAPSTEYRLLSTDYRVPTTGIARLAAEQGVLPVDDFDRLLGDDWFETGEHGEHV